MATKTVLITGATRGIGLSFVEHYIQEGWNVIAAARNVTKADQLRALSPYKIVQLDASDEESILNAAKELDGEAIDVLINNAGIGYFESFENANKKDMMHILDVNAVGPFLITRAFRQHLKRASALAGVAKVAHISSSFGSVALNDTGGFYGYRASKAALNMISVSLSIDLKEDGIASLLYHPGHVATDLSHNQGTVQTHETVERMTKYIAEATLKDSGKYFGESGEILPW